eukprot:1085420_1
MHKRRTNRRILKRRIIMTYGMSHIEEEEDEDDLSLLRDTSEFWSTRITCTCQWRCTIATLWRHRSEDAVDRQSTYYKMEESNLYRTEQAQKIHNLHRLQDNKHTNSEEEGYDSEA